ncbi:methyl-accepting chemotaxis protein [Actinoplanes sp. NPDC049548]|uniref:methyl-accepting chemotaxis protein n=1 Tax=Actinoplanes sp. NPDC049548 TaxID=3155152 RepID=UPI0034251176
MRWSVRVTFCGLAAGVVVVAALAGLAAVLPHTPARIAQGVAVLGGLGLAAAVALTGTAVSRAMRGLCGVLRAPGPAGRWEEISAVEAELADLRDQLTPLLSAATRVRDRLTPAAADLDQLLVNVSTAAKGTRDMFAVVEGTATDVAANVQVIAAGTEEMQAVIAEISRNAQQAAAVAEQATGAMSSGTTTMDQLGESSRQINEVIKSITSIAEQTNLLALNATIESARAGEAGKGFSVVAGEVKQLAQEAARAAEDVSRRVQTIQQDAHHAGRAIAEVAGMIHQMTSFQGAIADAMREQEATTRSMAVGITRAADGSADIAGTIQGRSAIAGNAAARMTGARQDLQDLRALGDEIGRVLDAFTAGVLRS